MAATYSPACAVPLARPGLTSLFGMGRGGSPALLPPVCLYFSFSYFFPAVVLSLLRYTGVLILESESLNSR